MQIPFATQAYARTRALTQEQKLVNWYVEKDASGSASNSTMLIQRPGLTRAATLGGPVKAVYEAGGNQVGGTYAVAGGQLYSIANGVGTALGAVAGATSTVSMTSNFDRVAIVSDGHIYIYGASISSTANTFREITLPDNFTYPVRAVDVAMLNDYLVFACDDGTYFWLAPGDDDWSGGTTAGANALNYATANYATDSLVGVKALDGNLYFFGTATVEIWQPQSDANVPFTRLTGQVLARGADAGPSICEYDNTLVWVSDNSVQRANNGYPSVISTSGIDEHIRLATAPTSAWTFINDGHEFYVLRVPGRGTFAYDASTKLWSEFASEGYDHWRAIVGCKTAVGYLCGDSETGALWLLSDTPTDDGTLIRRTVSASVPINGRPARVDNIVLLVRSSAACTWNFRWADADEDLTSQTWVSLPALQGADTLTYYRLGAARQPYSTIEVEITDPVIASMSGGRVNEAFQ